MEYRQRNSDDNYSTLTLSQPVNSLSSASSVTSVLDSTSNTTALMISKQSNINIDRSINRTRSWRKRYYQQQKQMEHSISSHSTATHTSVSHTTTTTTAIMEQIENQEKSLKNFSKLQKQEARPLGTCVRKCEQCRQLKHILLAECTICFRMMDIDLKDCKCQMFTNKNMSNYFTCSICNNELTLEGYIICANRTCQTTLSTLLNKENTIETQSKLIPSAIITDVYYPKSMYRTVAIQINTLVNLPPLQRFLSILNDNENEISLSSSECLDTFHMSIDSSVGAPLNNIATAFNSNQPTKLAIQSEHNLTNNLESVETPKLPRCLAIMNTHKRHDRLSTLLTLQTNQICQTKLSCLRDINEMIQFEDISNITIIQTNNPTKIECQIQVDTIKGHFDDLCQIRIETIDERILHALIDRDGQRWSKFIEQLINEQPHFSLSEIAQQLLDTVERLHTTQKLNSLTTGQLQRKIRYAMSYFKSLDEHLYLQNNLKTTRNDRSTVLKSKQNTVCNGRVDMAVTVRQIDKRHNQQSEISSEQNWKQYVDRLFDQGYSAKEIQQLLHDAAKSTTQCDNQRLQDVFNYIHTKAKQQRRVKTTSSGIEFISTLTQTKPEIYQEFQSTNLFQGIKTKVSHDRISTNKQKISNESSPIVNDKDQSSIKKRKFSSPMTLLNSSLVKPDIIQVELSKNTSIIDLTINEKEHRDTSATNTEQITQKENNHDQEFNSENIANAFIQRTSQIQELDKSKISITNETTSFHSVKNSSTIAISTSDQTDDIPLTNLVEKYDYALHDVQDTLNIDIQSKINHLIQIFESNIIHHDSLELLMKQYTELSNNEKKTIASQLEENDYQKSDKEISRTLTHSQTYEQIVTPFTINKEDSLFNRQISNEGALISDVTILPQKIEENIRQSIESSHSTLDLEQQTIVSEYQETASLIRCHPIPYTSLNEQISSETFKQVLIKSREQIPLETNDLDKEFIITTKNDFNNISNISSKTENDLHDDGVPTKWLNALFSKISDNVNSTTNIVPTLSSLLVSDRIKIDTNDKQSILYHADIILIKEEHTLSMIVPEYGFSKLHEQFEPTEIKNIEMTTAEIPSKQILNLEDQLPPFYEKKSNDNIFNEEQQSTSFAIIIDEPQLLVTESITHSDMELSNQIHQDTESSQSLFDSESDKKISPILAIEDAMVNSSSSIDENDNQDLIETNEPSTYINYAPHSSYVGTSMFSRHPFRATSIIFKHDNRINQFQLPILTQYFNISDIIQSKSLLTHLLDQTDSISFKESILNDNSTSDLKEHLSIDSEDQNNITNLLYYDEDKKQLNETINNTISNEFQMTTMLALNHHLTQQSTNTMLSPSQTPKSENIKYKKLDTPLPSSRESPSSPSNQISKENELTVEHNNIPNLLDKESSKSVTPLMKTTSIDKDEKSQKSITDEHALSIDDISKEDLTNKLIRSINDLQNEHTDLKKPSKESVSFNDTNHASSSSFSKSTENFSIDKTDNQQSKIELTINRTFSRPKINIEDIRSPPITTSHSSFTSTTSITNPDMKLRQTQTIPENTEKSSLDENSVESERVNSRDNSSKEATNIHSSSQFEQRRHDKDHQIEKIKSLTNENSSQQLLPSIYTMDSHSDKNDIKHEEKNQDQLHHHESKRTDSLSSTKKRPIMSTTITTLPSSTINDNIQDQNSKFYISSLENKNDISISNYILPASAKETQGLNNISSFNLTHMNNLISDKFDDSQKHPSSLSNSLVRNHTSSPSTRKLLSKRSSLKQTSNTVQPIRPNTILSITDVSTSSSNTTTTNHLLSTQSTFSDQKEIIPIQNTKKEHYSKDEIKGRSDSITKRKILRKTSRSIQNQSYTYSKSKEKDIEKTKKKFINHSLLTNSDLTYDSEQGSDAWMPSQEDISQILIIDEQDEKNSQIHKRYKKKQNKNRMITESQLMPFNLKARGDHQAYTIDSSKLPSIEQSCGEHQMKKLSNDPFRRPMIRLPVTQIEKFECGTIGPHHHSSSIARQLFYLPSIHVRHQSSSQLYQTNESLTHRFYRLMSSEKNDDKQAFESIINWQQQQQHHISKIEQNKYQYMYLLDPSVGNTVRGRQYPILTDEIDLIDDPNACTIVNKWAFADLVNNEREKYRQKSSDTIKKTSKRFDSNKNIKIYLRKRPLTQFEQNVFKEVDIISIIDSQTMLLHIPSITVDNQVFIKNRIFKCDQTFDEYCQINSIYHSTLSPLLDKALDNSKCLCLIGGGKYSGKTSLLRSLIDLFGFDLIHLLSTYDIYIKLLGICHNRIVDLLQNYSPIRLLKSMNWTLIPNDEFHVKTDHDIDYIVCQIKKRRRFIHQLIQINFYQKDQSIIVGSLMIVILASSQYIYSRNLCSYRRRFLINSLNKTILSLKRALLGIRQNPDRIRTAFNNDILTRLIQPYIFHERSNIYYIGTINPGHRHRIATKSTLEFARNLRFCLKRINKRRQKQAKLSHIISNDNDDKF
ncbi:unnamed protein product [Adineta steineri]|uniref:Kinesin motor domain-containing protein n=1 Tax=Adineta steineri TaxID=433720 RepID=A0A813P2J3_9BILA|nr:unnamed protein product [Adineta steineri]